MSAASLEVVSPGPLSSIQDRGRTGLRRFGIPWAGVLAPAWQTLANTLVGNTTDHPVLECFEGGLTLQAGDTELRIAVVGDSTVELRDALGDTRQVAAWRAYSLQPQEQLKITASGRTRCSYVAIHGLDVRIHHGSASTYARARLGGLDGGTLKTMDQLMACSAPADLPPLGLSSAHAETALQLMQPDGDALRLHAIPGPQQDAFDPLELTRFFDTQWQVGSETDRMGARLDGATLAHRDPTAKDIVSDAIVPGAIQVPGNGRPILMLADAATVGGYPKIATVASCDLAGIALARPGTQVQFVACSAADAVTHARNQAAHIDTLLARIEPVSSAPNTALLLDANLIDGVIDAADS